MIPINNHQHLHFSPISFFLKFLKIVLICKDMEVCINCQNLWSTSSLLGYEACSFSVSRYSGEIAQTAENQKGLHWLPLCFEFRGRGRQTCNCYGWFGMWAVAISEASLFLSVFHMTEALLIANPSPLLRSVGNWCRPCSKAANQRPLCFHWLHISTGGKGN